MITLPRETCIDLEQALDKEWLVSNGIGGFASGTVSGINTRRYHALLVAALQPPVERTVLLNNIDEEVESNGHTYYLGANEYPDGKINPGGFVHIEEFRLQDNIPTTMFRMGDNLLEKTIWMEHGHNTSYIHYNYVEGEGELCLLLNPMVNYRDYHSMTEGAFDWDFGVEPLAGGCKIVAREGAQPFWLTTDGRADFTHTGVWYWNFVYRREVERGYDTRDNMYVPGILRCVLMPGDSVTLIASTEHPDATAPLVAGSLERERARQHRLVRAAGIRSKGADADPSDPDAPLDAFQAQLVRAADTFMVLRDLRRDGSTQQVPTVLAGYPWFTDWGRDTMIALPGLSLPTGRVREANKILRTFAHFAREGLIPNNFPDEGGIPHYNTADATLWMFAAVERLAEGTGSLVTARGLFPMLSDVIAWHVRGTRYGIGMDPADGLLQAGQEGVQLTWMDAKVDDWVVTPRIGKPVEINALWYNALRVMNKLKMAVGRTVPAGHMEQPDFGALAERARASFRHRFWRSDVRYLYDVLDGPDGDDASLRPNQLIALSLSKDLLTAEQARGVLKSVREHLLTPYGLRTLSPQDSRYVPHYRGDRRQRDAAYHMGTVWTWLLGPYFDAVASVEGREAASAELDSMLPNLRRHMAHAGLGTISEVFDAEEPFAPGGCISQAWSVAELLRVLANR
ncbi:MAG: amylo-alpha-1,6-glucosidase [Chloroflexota bacterium]